MLCVVANNIMEQVFHCFNQLALKIISFVSRSRVQ